MADFPGPMWGVAVVDAAAADEEGGIGLEFYENVLSERPADQEVSLLAAAEVGDAVSQMLASETRDNAPPVLPMERVDNTAFMKAETQPVDIASLVGV